MNETANEKCKTQYIHQIKWIPSLKKGLKWIKIGECVLNERNIFHFSLSLLNTWNNWPKALILNYSEIERKMLKIVWKSTWNIALKFWFWSWSVSLNESKLNILFKLKYKCSKDFFDNSNQLWQYINNM